ncbi:uncharacterized protein LOC114515599 [Dendronephthya gigantea]|uniref:uncharacterized protein LOC114515599 n=1 Tax=Dendronephthya gigantea TaxID=151771 RepID=UPI001069EA72|nr:uncharacterized protein LOC114515599 [Dendronephthya gigantea]
MYRSSLTARRLSARHIPGQVDLVFVMSCTESMRYIIRETAGIVRRVAQSQRLASSSSSAIYDIRFALVKYRGDDGDPLQGPRNNHVFGFYNFSGSSQDWFHSMICEGNNSPFAMADGLNMVLRLQFRPTATKICFWIGDWNLQGNQGLSEICHRMAAKGIVLHCIGCNQPNNQSAESTFDFMGVTGGLYTPVQRIRHITRVIVCFVQEEVHIENLIGHVEDHIELERRFNPNATDSELEESLNAAAEPRNNPEQNGRPHNQQNSQVYTTYSITFPQTISELKNEQIEKKGNWPLMRKRLISRTLAQGLACRRSVDLHERFVLFADVACS